MKVRALVRIEANLGALETSKYFGGEVEVIKKGAEVVEDKAIADCILMDGWVDR